MNPFDRLLSIMVKPWVAVCIIALIIISFVYLDEPIAYFFHNLNLRETWFFLNWVTKLGLGAVYIIGLLALALLFRYIVRNPIWESRAWFLWLCVVFPSLICLGLKIMLGRARPSLLFGDQLYGFYGFQTHAPFWSFPSGHSTTIMGLVFGLSAVFPRYCLTFMISGLLIASSRIVLTHHYLSDVMTAMYLALLEVGLLLCWFRRREWLSVSSQCQGVG